MIILNKLSLDKFEPVQVNLLLSLAYEFDSDPLLASKFRAIAFVQRLRQLELLNPAGT